MILVRAIGMSGYVPLECVVGLSHALLRYRYHLGTCEYKCEYRYGFEYLGVGEIDKTNNLDVLRSVVSLAVVHRFDDHARSILIHDIGLNFGYYCAGVVFPNKLRLLLRDVMGLNEYHILARFSQHPKYSSLNFVYISAWYEYVCLDPDISYVYDPPIFIRILGSKNSFPTFLFNKWRHVLS